MGAGTSPQSPAVCCVADWQCEGQTSTGRMIKRILDDYKATLNITLSIIGALLKYILVTDSLTPSCNLSRSDTDDKQQA